MGLLTQARAGADGRLAGAVAVSGATSIQDHEIVERAAAAVR